MELWDAYNSKGELVECKTLIRGERIPEGLYHLVCDIIVRHKDGTYLLMQRDIRKHCGGMWEASAGGSALKGEFPVECALRELKEETGITARELKEVGRAIHHSRQTIYVEYLCVTDQAKDSVVLQEGETQAYKWVDCETLLSMKKQELITAKMQIFIEELWL